MKKNREKDLQKVHIEVRGAVLMAMRNHSLKTSQLYPFLSLNEYQIGHPHLSFPIFIVLLKGDY